MEDYDAAERLSSGDAAKAVAAERDEYRVEIRLASVAPARTGPMTFEEIEDEDEVEGVDANEVEGVDANEVESVDANESANESANEPKREREPEPSSAPSSAPSKPSDDGRRRIVIEEDDSDEEEEETVSASEKETVSASGKETVSSIAFATAARSLKATGDDAFKRGDMEAADAAYGECLSHPGASSDDSLALAVRANRAAARLKLADFVGAEQDACAALAIDPSHVKATHRRAAARVKLGKFDDALADYAVVKRAFPKHRGVAAEVEKALATAAEAKKTRDDPPSASSEPASPAASKGSSDSESPKSSASEIPKSPAETARAKATEAAAALKEKGNEAFARGSYADAVTRYDAAVKMCVAAGDPKMAAILLANRAAAKIKLGLHADAEKDASAAIAKDSGYVKAFHRRAQARRDAGKFEEALEDYEAVVRANPENETLREEVNACMQKAAEAMLGSLSADAMGRASAGAAAGSSRRRAVSIQPDSDDDSDDDDDERGIVDAAERERDDAGGEGADTHAEKDDALETPEREPPSTRRRVPIVEEDSDSDSDADDDEPSEEPHPTSEVIAPASASTSAPASVSEAAESAKARGNDLFRAGDFAGADAAYGEAIALAPDSAAYLANRAAARLKLGDASGALADATEATRLDPKHARARHRRAVALSSLGRHVEAAAEYDAVERDIPNHAGVKAEAAAAREKARAEQARAEQARAEEPKVADAFGCFAFGGFDARGFGGFSIARRPSPDGCFVYRREISGIRRVLVSCVERGDRGESRGGGGARVGAGNARRSRARRRSTNAGASCFAAIPSHCPSSCLGCLTMSSRAW